MSDSPPPYRVLARKYRPQSFAELIGQDAMVQTLANAIKRDRLAHAFLMTGVRGVGKTSTARLIAKALNCVGGDGKGGPTIDPCGTCEPCIAIAEGRHIDVIEMDAASHTGIDDVREIIEAVRYSAVSARFKMYIIDEAHMLSKQAWNGLLKTLEEPPEHVKFLFATTEVNKVPVTVLSRCQRFDLRRIPAAKLQAHFAAVSEKEGVRAEPGALALIAQAAEGSARDGLSLLDRAIAHAEEGGAADALVSAEQVREMLGLSDRTAVRRLLSALLEADAPAMLDLVREHHELGVEPLATIRGLMELVHAVMLDKIGRGLDDPTRSVEEKAAIGTWASGMGHAELHRLWQLLLKAHGEVAAAAMPMETCEMALLRCLHAASLPDPGEVARMLREGVGALLPQSGLSGPATSGTSAHSTPSALSVPPPAAEPQNRMPGSFIDMIDLVERQSATLGYKLREEVGLIRFAPPELVLKPLRAQDSDFNRQIAERLYAATDQRWQVSLDGGDAQPSLRQQDDARKSAEKAEILAAPMVQVAMAAFPEAELIQDEPNEQWNLGT